MIIVLKRGSSETDIKNIESRVHEKGLKTHVSKGEFRTLIGVIGDERKIDVNNLKAISCVEKVMPIMKAYQLASREFKKEDTVIKVNGAKIGGGDFAVMAGPCAIESEEQLMKTAYAVKECGLKILRASAYKPRTSPYDFQGMREEGIALLKKAKEKTGLVTETEVMDIRQIDYLSKNVDILRVGSRNMQNFDLLRELGKIKNPVVLKRGMSSTIKEFLLAAEYIISEGNPNVIMCERGIKTFETATRNTLDLSAVPIIKQESHLPIIIDPSHSTGNRNYVESMCMAALACGADGLLIEVHPDPESALCDGPQSVTLEQLKEIVGKLRMLAPAVGKRM